jgi:hypothetical protein
MSWLNPEKVVPTQLTLKTTAALAAFFISMGSVSAHADESEDAYWIFDDEPTVEVVDEGPLTRSRMETILPSSYGFNPFKPFLSNSSGSALDQAEVAIDKVINIGKKLWAIVDANRPVVELQTNTANALPLGVASWDALEGWEAPTSKLFTHTYRNLWRIKVVQFSYRVIYTWGGSLDGKGRYLANVTVIPADVDVISGYKLNAQASVPSVLNASRVKGEPLAAAELLVTWKVETALKHSRRSRSFYVRGDGVFKDLN